MSAEAKKKKKNTVMYSYKFFFSSKKPTKIVYFKINETNLASRKKTAC